MRHLVTLAIALLIFGVSAASAKEFRPGDLRLCGATQCRLVIDGPTNRHFGALLYGDGRVAPAPAPTPGVGSPVFQLRFRDGPAAVILNATAFRVHGLNCGRFRRGHWYRLPAALRGLTTGLKPKQLRARVPPSC
jgi:hypothetical protein